MIKFLARNTVFPILVATGAEKMMRRFSTGNVLNLMYHGVVEHDSTEIFPRHITQEKFAAHLKYFKTNFEILTLSEALQLQKEKGKMPKKAITISFDDGYENNLNVALPLLEAYQVPATFFISSICIENPDAMMWPDIVSFARLLEPTDTVRIGDFYFKKTGRFELWNPRINKTAGNYLKCLPPTERDFLITELYDRYHLHESRNFFEKENWKLMNANQLKRLAGSPIATIGSHGHLHYNLGEISPEAAYGELKISKRLIEGCLGQPVQLFAFPDGSYNARVKALARQVGYTGLVAVDPRYKEDRTEPDMMLRYGVSSTTSVSSNLLFINHQFGRLAFC